VQFHTEQENAHINTQTETTHQDQSKLGQFENQYGEHDSYSHQPRAYDSEHDSREPAMSQET